ncbi:unnamed protein product [Effrenium voratum]|uniref:Uncharacterized protein n=1 Tax=Effrenium voratum TaxID=2562239 RepID=A0AA36IU62_9DINO|nr:unnamed protein product [Effrenium voratum]
MEAVPEVHLTLGMAILAGGQFGLTSSADAAAMAKDVAAELAHACASSQSGSGACSVCEDGLQLQDVIEFRRAYHNLAVEGKSFLLSTCYAEGSASSDYTRVRWRFLGKRVCTRRLLKLLGTSARTFTKAVQGSIDKRQFNGRQATEASMSVNQFFLEVYHSAAEFLPEDPSCHVTNVDASINADELEGAPATASKPACHPTLPLLGWDPSESMVQDLGAAALGNPEPLPTRYVQHLKPVDLWWQYLAWALVRCPQSKTASWSTFWRAWQPDSESRVLCIIIDGLDKNKGTDARLRGKISGVISALHFFGEVLFLPSDRQVYTSVEAVENSAHKLSAVQRDAILNCILHSSHLEVLDKFNRPRITVHAAMAHGYTCDFYLADDEDFFHGASFFCEVLTRTLARVQRIAEGRGQRMPEHLVVQSDNTTAQAKNAEVPEELRLAILSLTCMTGMSAIVAGKGYDLHCELMSHVRNFKEWMDPMCVHPHNCWRARQGIESPHSFTFKLRMDLTQAEFSWLQQSPTDRGWPAHELDVFVVVKHYMASESPNGPPVLLIPNSRYLRMQQAAPQGSCYATHPMNEKRRKELRKLAEALETLSNEWAAEHSYFRAARELRLLANGRDALRSTDGFLEAASADRRAALEPSAAASVACFDKFTCCDCMALCQGQPLLSKSAGGVVANACQVQLRADCQSADTPRSENGNWCILREGFAGHWFEPPFLVHFRLSVRK